MQQITSMVTGSASTAVAGAAAFRGGGPFLGSLAMQGMQQIIGNLFNYMSASNRFADIKQNEKIVLANAVANEFKVDIERRRVEEDRTRFIRTNVNQTSTNLLLDRDLITMKNELFRVRDYHIKRITPNARQMTLINAYYGDFGVSCYIPGFNLI